MDRREQDRDEDQSDEPADHREHRREQVVEGEDAGPEDRDPVEVHRPLVVLDRRHLGLEARDVALEHDVQPVAEPADGPRQA